MNFSRMGIFFGQILLSTLLLVSCGGDSSSSSWTESFTDGLAIASPTALSSSRTLRADGRAPSLSGTETFAEKTATLTALADGTASSCHVTLPTLGGFNGRAECYGPQVNYSNHPDGTPASGQFPTGDLGIWQPTQGSDACAAAQMNSLVAATSVYLDTALAMEASAICLLAAEGTAFPSAGSEVDFTSTFSTSLTTNNSGATVTSAKASLADGITQYLFEGTTDGARGYKVTIRIKKTSDTVFQGRIYGYFTTQNKDAFSMTFSRDGTTLKVRMVAGSWVSSTADSTILNSSGDLILQETWTGNMNQAIVNLNTDTGVGNVSYAWQAGAGDDRTRVFNVYTTSSRATISGCGFFGYGNEFVESYDSNTNTISGFICNWAGPSNDHSMSSTGGKAQKQCFTQSGSNMSEVTAKRAITYAPANSCNDSGSFTYDLPSHSSDGATNDLITLSSDSDYSNYTAPTAPTLDSGV